MNTKPTPGKIILFGEHIILVGGRALAMPMQSLNGKWAFEENDVVTPFKNELIAFGEFLRRLNPNLSFDIDVDNFITDINNGMHFDSNIPVGYGAGSSGAIVAAICQKYSTLNIEEIKNLTTLQKELGLMENYFHGASSGIDPLISLLNQPLLIDSEGTVTKKNVSTSFDKITFFLLDTEISRQTSPLVAIFRKQMQDRGYENAIRSQLIPINNLAIDQLIQEDISGLKDSFQKISQLQYQLFLPMIPKAFQKLWIKGLMSDLYCLKLCGAGGGGFLLGMTDDLERTKFVFKDMKLVMVE